MFTPELDLRAIQIFLAVAEGKSVKKASEKLKISSPAISQALKLLEEYLGTELFCREVRPLRLTASGKASTFLRLPVHSETKFAQTSMFFSRFA